MAKMAIADANNLAVYNKYMTDQKKSVFLQHKIVMGEKGDNKYKDEQHIILPFKKLNNEIDISIVITG